MTVSVKRSEYPNVARLEALPFHRYVPYISRTKDFIDYEIALRNPIMTYNDDDKKIYRKGHFKSQQINTIENAANANNSDTSICEFEGKAYMVYSWGNQFGKEFLAMAEYDGPIEELVKSFFV